VLLEAVQVRALAPADLTRARETLFRQWLENAKSSAKIEVIPDWQKHIPDEPSLKELGLPTLR
jgi:hypothetical protein